MAPEKEEKEVWVGGEWVDGSDYGGGGGGVSVVVGAVPISRLHSSLLLPAARFTLSPTSLSASPPPPDCTFFPKHTNTQDFV